jgi:hypothetical protein
MALDTPFTICCDDFKYSAAFLPMSVPPWQPTKGTQGAVQFVQVESLLDEVKSVH